MKLETPDVMAFLRGIVSDLRTKKLWPVVAVLIAAIVAVPIALSKSGSGHTPAAQASPGTPPPANAVPALNVQTTPGQSKLTGHARNPFGQPGSSGTSTTASGVVTATSTATASGSSTPSTGGVSTS